MDFLNAFFIQSFNYHTGAPQRSDLTFDISDIRLSLDPVLFDLANSLASSALAPLMQPGPDQAVRAVTQFEKIWSFDPVADLQQQEQVAVSTTVTGAGGGVTVWRPKTVTGYGVLGFVVTPGEGQPAFEVLSVAVNSGLVAYPVDYTLIW